MISKGEARPSSPRKPAETTVIKYDGRSVDYREYCPLANPIIVVHYGINRIGFIPRVISASPESATAFSIGQSMLIHGAAPPDGPLKYATAIQYYKSLGRDCL